MADNMKDGDRLPASIEQLLRTPAPPKSGAARVSSLEQYQTQFELDISEIDALAQKGEAVGHVVIVLKNDSTACTAFCVPAPARRAMVAFLQRMIANLTHGGG